MAGGYTGETIDATDIYLNAGVGGVGLGVPPNHSFNPFGSALESAGNPFALLNAGFGALNPAVTPSGSANATGTATGTQTVATGGSANPGTTDTGSASVPGSLQNYFTRGVVIVLGFIFIAAGLWLFARK